MYACFKSNILAISLQISNISIDLQHIQAKSIAYSLIYNPWFLSLLLILSYSSYSIYYSLILGLFPCYFGVYPERVWKPSLWHIGTIKDSLSQWKIHCHRGFQNSCFSFKSPDLHQMQEIPLQIYRSRVKSC